MITTAVGAIGSWWAAERLGARRPWVPALVAAVALTAPFAGLATGAVLVARARWRRARSARLGAEEAEADVTVLADLLVLGLTAGLSLRASLDAAARHVHPGVRRDIADLAVRVDRHGMGAGLAATTGRLEGLARVAAGATVSGAPLGTALTAFARARRHESHTARMEAARRLPVRLLLPLALLILPGFVALAVGPAVLEGLARLGPIP
ncbi:MAG: type II secretion system F family protein [Thermoanaerobaculia bacterium]|nr:type II secretion system F family protein [Thermoanaerobaculia bacterium]